MDEEKKNPRWKEEVEGTDDTGWKDVTLKTRVTLGTKLYSKFTLISGNRGVSEAHIDKLVAMITADEDWLTFNPITVDSNLRVLDGQHRLIAAQKANVHIWYKIRSKKTSLEVVARINDCQKSWTPDDFVFMYATLGNVHYKAFWEFYKGYGLSPSTGLILFGGQSMKSLRNGTLKVVDILKAEEIADALMDVKKYVPFADYNRFASAFVRVFENKEYNHKRMLTKLRQRKDVIRKLATVEDYMRMLEDIYNHKLPVTDKIRFF